MTLVTDSDLFAFTLIHANRWVGVLIAIVGSVVVAPSGTALLWHTAADWTIRRRQQLRAQVARVVPFLRRPPRSVSASVKATIGMTGTVTAIVAAAPLDPAAPLEEQIAVLYRHIQLLEARLTLFSDQQSQENRNREKQVTELQKSLLDDIGELRRLVEEKDHEGARIDARGLPVIGFGILLSGVPDELASIPWGLGWIFPIVGLGAGVATALTPWRRSRGR